MDVKKIKQKLLIEKAIRKQKIKERKNRKEDVAYFFKELDKYGKGMWLYNSTKKTRKNLLKILKRSRKNKQRKALVKKIGEEFQEIYIAYRNLVLILHGQSPTYRLLEDERERFERAAIACLQYDITLKQLFFYWHKNIKNFAGGKKALYLGLICSTVNIEMAACEVMEDDYADNFSDNKKKKTQKEEFEDWVASKNSFSDMRKLDPELRKGLKRDNIKDVDRYSDRQLLTVQIIAKDVSRGYEIYISEEIQPMVEWAVKNLYGGKK